MPAGRLIKVNKVQSLQQIAHSLISDSHQNVSTNERKVSNQQFENSLLGKIRNNYSPPDTS